MDKNGSHQSDAGRRAAALAAAALIGSCLAAPRAEAIATFSRELKTECTTCHTIFPQLNEFGQAFERNGFVWPGMSKKKVSTAQTPEERKSAEFIKLSGLPAVVPVSFLASVSYTYNEKVEDDFEMKNVRGEIFAAGVLGGDKIGYWYHAGIGGQSGATTSTPGSPSNLYLVVRDPLGLPLHVKAGKFGPNLSLWKTSLSGSLMSSGYNDGVSVTGAQNAIEVSGVLGSRVEAVVGMNDKFNVTGKDGKGVDVTHSVNDFYARLAAKVGGADLRGKEPDIDLDKDSVWDYLSIAGNVFAYRGNLTTGSGEDKDYTRYGLEAEAAYKKVLVKLGAGFGENNLAARAVKSGGYSAEVDYLHSPRFGAALRYDTLDVDGKDRRSVVSPVLIFAPIQNFRLRLAVSVDSNANNGATDLADANTTATLSASMVF